MGKKDDILLRSTDVFLKFGLHKISMDELADQIGVSKKTIYNYFGSKENLLEAIIHKKMESLLEILSEILLSRETTIIEKMATAINTICTQYATFENAVTMDPNASRILNCPECILLNDRIQDAVENLASSAKKQGLIKNHISPEMLPYIFLNIIRGLSAWNRPENLSFTKFDLMKHSIDISLDGILTPKALEEFHNS